MCSIVTDDILDKFSELKDVSPTSNDGKKIVAPFLELFSSFLAALDNKFESFKKEMSSKSQVKDEKIKELESIIVAQRAHISTLETKLEDQCQYTRRESIVLSGKNVPAHRNNEDCIQIACDLIANKIDPNLQIVPACISIAHRLGNKPTSGEDHRSIIVRFCRRKLKYDILNKAKQSKPQGLFVSESLTPTKQKLVRIIRNAKHAHPDLISGYSTSDGSIYMWVKPPNADAPGARNSRMIIDSLAKLDKFCLENFQVPAAHFDKTRPAPPHRERWQRYGESILFVKFKFNFEYFHL